MKRYYFPNTVVAFEGLSLEVTSGGAVYQRDEQGSLRRRPAIWLARLRRFEVELLDGRMVDLSVVDGKLTASPAAAVAV